MGGNGGSPPGDSVAAGVGPRPFRLGLRGRYTLYGAALTTAVVMVLTTLSYFNARALTHGIAEGQLAAMVRAIADPVEHSLRVAQLETVALAEQPLLANALLDSEGRDAYLRPFLAQHQLPVKIDYNLILTDHRGEPLAARKSPQGFHTGSWLQGVIENGEVRAEIDPHDTAVVLRIAVPVLYRVTGTREGALVFEASLRDWLSGVSSPFGLRGEGIVRVELLLDDQPVVQRTFGRAQDGLVTSAQAIDAGLPMVGALKVRVSMDDAVFGRPVNRLLVEHLVWGALAVALVGAASGVLARTQTRRIEELAEEARSIATTGQPRRGLAPGGFGNDEVGDLAASLVLLLESLRAHQAELELEVAQRTADLNRAQAIAHVGSWVYQPGLSRLDLSPETLRIFGIGSDVVLSWRRLLAAVHPEDRATVRQAWSGVIGGVPFDIEHRVFVDGEVHWVRQIAEMHAMADGQPRCVGTVEDITRRRLTEARMREAMVVFHASSQGIMTTDADGIISSVNPAFCRITGFAAEDVIGHKSSVFRSGRHDAAFYEAMWTALKGGGEWAGEIWNRRNNGEIYPQWLTISAVRGEHDRIVEYVALFSDITERKQHENEIWRQANFDALTGLANRSLLYDRLDRAIAQARRAGRKVGLIFLDLDGFKWVNDTLGHDIGDGLLVEVAQRLKGCVRDEDTVARLGGDEFTIVVGELHDAQNLRGIGEKLLRLLGEPFVLAGAHHHISASVGITVYPDDGDDVQTLLRNADIAMYKAKQNGKNRFYYFVREMQTDALQRMRTETDLRTAIAQDAFTLMYQPVIDADSGELVGAEALIRWQHPERGTVAPADFIPVAEDSGLIVPIGAWVIREAARQWHEWDTQGLTPLRLAVNVSGVQFRDAGLPALLASALDEYGVGRDCLVLEICESVMVDGNAATETRMREIREQGIAYAIDDFGTGFSSLSCLKRFPVDFVKIDRSFIRDCPDDRNDVHLVEAIISMTHSLGLKVVAEGVETEDQLDLLRELGCDYLQGYLVGRPVPPGEFASLMRQRVLISPRRDAGRRAAVTLEG